MTHAVHVENTRRPKSWCWGKGAGNSLLPLIQSMERASFGRYLRFLAWGTVPQLQMPWSLGPSRHTRADCLVNVVTGPSSFSLLRQDLFFGTLHLTGLPTARLLADHS
jgi:hypothetical protein